MAAMTTVKKQTRAWLTWIDHRLALLHIHPELWHTGRATTSWARAPPFF